MGKRGPKPKAHPQYRTLGGRQREVLERLVRDSPLLASDLYALPVQWRYFTVLSRVINTLVVAGFVTCSEEVTLPTSTITITPEGRFVADEHFEDVDKGLYDDASWLMIKDVGKRLRAGAKVCVITSVQRRGRVKDSLMRAFRHPENLVVTSIGDSGIILKSMTLAGADHEVFIEPVTLEAHLGETLKFYNKYRHGIVDRKKT
jgi:hypothetical protein